MKEVYMEVMTGYEYIMAIMNKTMSYRMYYYSDK